MITYSTMSIIIIFFVLTIWSPLVLRNVLGQITFDTRTTSTNRVTGLSLKQHLFVPYGPDALNKQNSTNGEIWDGYGYGLGAVEHFAYDPIQRYVYTQSEFGPYITIIDYSSIETPMITPYSIDLSEYNSDIRDVAVCGTHLMIVATEINLILQYETIQRKSPMKPKLLNEIMAGIQPDNIRFNPNCTILAVANENDGSGTAVGAIHLVTNFNSNGAPTVREVAFDKFDDAYYLSRQVHMPLTLKAMEYWDDYSNIANDIDWSNVREIYNPNLFLQPEFIQFSPDSTTLLVNLQTNSALARIDVASATLLAVDGYGLKSWTSGEGIDILDDGNCTLVTHPLLYSLRAPDGIASVEIDGTLYVLTANEGSDFDYTEYEENIDAGDLFNGLVLGHTGFYTDDATFSTTNSSIGDSIQFNSQCDPNIATFCANGLEITLGSSAVDYTNVTNPKILNVVAFGGRGMSIYQVPSASDGDVTTAKIELIWDSKSEFELQGCTNFPWAHNGVQDENFAPIDGALYFLSDTDVQQELDDANDPEAGDGCEDAGNGLPGACPISETIDEKAVEDGLAPESVVVAIACDRLVAVSCGENNGNCYIYDITDISSPVFVTIFNLSPASELKSPGVAYDDRTLGDIDAETLRYVPANESPTGLSGIMFGGAHSGTLSFYEFECTESVDPVKTVFVGNTDVNNTDGNSTSDDNNVDNTDGDDGLSTGAIVGIVIGALAGVAILAAMYMSSNQKRPTTDNDVEVTKPEQDLS